MKNIQSQIKVKNSQAHSGFTLIEILIVLAVMLIVIIVVLQTTSALFKGSNRSSSIADVKQSGSYALSVMEQVIRASAPTPACLGTTGVQVVVKNNSLTPTPVGLRTITFACTTAPDGRLILSQGIGATPTYTPLIGNNVQVKAASCIFTCPGATPGDQSRVNMAFDLTTYTQSGITPRPEETEKESFSTTVIQRSY